MEADTRPPSRTRASFSLPRSGWADTLYFGELLQCLDSEFFFLFTCYHLQPAQVSHRYPAACLIEHTFPCSPCNPEQRRPGSGVQPSTGGAEAPGRLSGLSPPSRVTLNTKHFEMRSLVLVTAAITPAGRPSFCHSELHKRPELACNCWLEIAPVASYCCLYNTKTFLPTWGPIPPLMTLFPQTCRNPDAISFT